MDIKATLKKIPLWGWAAIGGIGILGLSFLRRSSSQAVAVIPAEPQRTTPAPSPGAGGGSSSSVDLSPIMEALQSQGAAIAQLAKQQTETAKQVQSVSRTASSAYETASSAYSTARKVSSRQRATEESVSALGDQVNSIGWLTAYGMGRQLTTVPGTGDAVTLGRSAPAGTTPDDAAAVAPSATAKRASTIETITIQRWQQTDQYAGYVQEKVTVDTAAPSWTYEQRILEAKQQYLEAERRGDVAGMNQAHEAANRAREEAAKAGVQLGEWTGSGGYQPRSASAPKGINTI